MEIQGQMERFIAYVAGYGDVPERLAQDVLQAVYEKYPWFTTPCFLSGEMITKDALVELHLTSHPCPVPLLEEAAASPEAAESSQADLIIERFLSGGEHRIVPRENAPEYDAAQECSKLDISDEMVSEELAEIYLGQGLHEQAKEIYRKLSLLYPEKSVYFAEIIDGTDRRNEQV